MGAVPGRWNGGLKWRFGGFLTPLLAPFLGWSGIQMGSKWDTKLVRFVDNAGDLWDRTAIFSFLAYLAAVVKAMAVRTRCLGDDEARGQLVRGTRENVTIICRQYGRGF